MGKQSEAVIAAARVAQRKSCSIARRLPPHSNFFFPAGEAPLTFAAMPSFDIVSQVNSMEIENAVNQAKKELASRFDFKGSKAEIVLEKNEIKLTAEDQFKIKALGTAEAHDRRE